MIENYLGNKTKRLFKNAIIFLTILSIFNNIPNGNLSALGNLIIISLSFIILLTVIIYIAIRRVIPQTLGIPIILSLIFISLNCIGLITSHDYTRSTIVIYQFIFIISFFLVCTFIKWDNINFISRFVAFIVLINFILLITIGAPTKFSGLVNNSNVLGVFLFLYSFFILMKLRNKFTVRWLLLLVLTLVLIYFSDTRSILICIFAAFFTYCIWGLLKKSKRLFTFYFLIVICGIASFTFIYPQLIYRSDFLRLNSWVFTHTGKQLFSGREVLWSQLFDVIKNHFWLGYGPGASPSTVIDTSLSSHNLYLQITLQTGIIGITIFLLLLLSIWRLYWYGRNNKYVRLSASTFVGIIIHETFEVMFVQNNLAVALLEWLIISIGISFSRQQFSKDQKSLINK